MKKKILITACSFFMLLGTASAQKAQLEKAFTAISRLDGFHTYTRQQLIDNGWSEEDGRLSQKMGDVRMTIHPNADPREQVLAILDNIPGSLLYDEERNERQIWRGYTETDANDVGYLMLVYVGHGSSDTVVIIYKGCDEDTYKAILDKGK